MPKRIQMRRDRPWRVDHPDAVIVARPSKWGNPFSVGAEGIPDRATAVEMFRAAVVQSPPSGLHDLRGKDLACWCPLGQPCHADVLLELANEKE